MATSSTSPAQDGIATPRLPFWIRTARHKLGKFRARNRRFYRTFTMPAELERELLKLDHELAADTRGRCPFRKMQALAGLIARHDLRRAVEIGVYRGSSLLPQALAMRRTGGEVTGIDPWSRAGWDEQESRSPGRAPTDDTAGEIRHSDWDHLYQEVLNQIERRGLQRHCHVIRTMSHEAASQIGGPVDLLHIDGNHDYDAVARDLNLYLPKLRSGGFLVVDDIGWQGVAPHYRDLKLEMTVVWEAVTWGVLRRI